MPGTQSLQSIWTIMAPTGTDLEAYDSELGTTRNSDTAIRSSRVRPSRASGMGSYSRHGNGEGICEKTAHRFRRYFAKS